MYRKKIAINTFINVCGKFLSFAIQLFIITYLIKNIGKDSYGIMVLALALVGSANLLEAGFGLSITKYVAECNAKGEEKRLLEIVNTNFVVTTVLALVFCAVIFIINEFFIDKIFTIPYILVNTTKDLIRILILFALIEFWAVGIVRVAEGFQRFSLIRGIESFKWFLRAVFTVAAIETGYGLVGIGIAYLCSGIINLAVLYLFVFDGISKVKLDLRLCNKESFRLLFGFSIWIFLSKVFAFISYRIDTIVIGIFLPPVNIAYYNIAFKIYEVLNYGFSLISSTLVPVASEMEAAMDRKRLAMLFKKASKYTVMLMYPILIFFFFYSERIIRLWVGSGFDVSVLLNRLLIISLFFMAVVFSGTVMMVGINKARDLIKYNAIASVVNLIISVILVREIGVYGVVLGTLAGTFIVAAGYFYRMMYEFNFSSLSFLSDIVLKPALLTIVLFGIFMITQNIYISILGIAIYFLTAFAFMADKDDREGILRLVKGYV
ncbi:oligosaccharide flippase family protein [Dissulfurispira sp.]|uniref:oligosaccharide flippase family protein n=1 Tax=Dissulfurispira sp. TaxID=2817609 RepID=UPI002FD87E53